MTRAEFEEDAMRTARALGRTTAQLADTKLRLEQSQRLLAEAEETIVQLREMLERAHA